MRLLKCSSVNQPQNLFSIFFKVLKEEKPQLIYAGRKQSYNQSLIQINRTLKNYSNFLVFLCSLCSSLFYFIILIML